MLDSIIKKITVLLFCSCPIFVYAQDSLNLEQITTQVLNENFDIRIVKSSETINNKQNNWGMSGILPRISLNISDRYNISKRDNPTSFINGKITTNNLSPTIQLDQNIFNGFQAWISKSNYDLLENMSQQNTELVILNSIKAVYLSYYQVQLQNQLIQNQLKLLKLSDNQENYYTLKYQQGLITTPEWKTYQSFSLEDSINLFNLESNLLKYLGDIQKLTGLEKINVKKDSLPILPPSLDKAEWQSKLKNNPNLKLAILNEALKANELKSTQAAQYPSITGNAGFNYQRSNFDVETRGKGVGTSVDYYVGFALNFNIFNGFKLKTQTEIAKIETEIQGLKTEQLEQKISLELDQYLENYDQYHQQFEMSNKLSKIAESTLNYWSEKQKAGLITSLELRNYQKNVLLYQNQSNQSWYKCFQQWIEIQSICGIIGE